MIFTVMNNSKQAAARPFNATEKTVLLIVFVLMIIGIVAANVNKTWFLQQYVVEDGFIEDLTLIPLAIITLTAIIYLVKYARRKNAWFFLVYLGIGLASFFVLGEEISWGQRIFNFQTSEYFKEHNSQDEENIHNLVLDGERLNKIIFTNALVVCVIIYLIVLPLLYQKNLNFRNFIDKAGVPVPTVQQAIACALVFGSSFLTFDDKGAELLEFGGSAVFMLIVLFPVNKFSLSMQRK